MDMGRISKGPERTDVIGSGIETISGGLDIAQQQGPAFLETAIQSFSWASRDDFAPVRPDLLASKKAPFGEIGFMDSPADYLERLSKFPGRSALPTVLKQLRAQGFQYNWSIGTFVGNGMLEVLRELKGDQTANPASLNLPISTTLDDLLPAEKRKNADPAMVQNASDALEKMLSTLKELSDASLDLHVNMLHKIRA